MEDISLALKKNPERSAAYPGTDLEITAQLISDLNSSLGSGPFSREAAAQALGHKGLSGTAVRKVAALVHFGLLDRVGNTYKLSELANKILFYTSDENKEEAIKEAVRKPKLYDLLIKKFLGASLPSLLPNILISQFQINKNVAVEAAKDFKKSLEFAGLLKNGVVLDDSFEGEKATLIEAIEGDSNMNKTTLGEKVSTTKLPENGLYQAPSLPSGIIIIFPENLKTAFVLGEFSAEIKNLENKAKEILSVELPKES